MMHMDIGFFALCLVVAAGLWVSFSKMIQQQQIKAGHRVSNLVALIVFLIVAIWILGK